MAPGGGTDLPVKPGKRTELVGGANISGVKGNLA